MIGGDNRLTDSHRALILGHIHRRTITNAHCDIIIASARLDEALWFQYIIVTIRAKTIHGELVALVLG